MLKKYKITIRICAFLLITSLLLSGVCIDTQAKSSSKKNGQSDQSTECPYKNKEKTQLFIEDKKLSYSKSTSDTISESNDLIIDNSNNINSIEFINKKKEENCFGPKRQHMSYTSNALFKPY